ncbi:hypothetical protein MESS4_830414 [Mesorhizobium sp. STM 4661]|nr:hypothetical protein MESS4_830414 [Mesorhizobium sp. STM 4661]
MLSEAFWANEGVSQVGEKEQGHTATEDIVDKHVVFLPLKTVASFDVGEGQSEKQNPYPDNDDVHGTHSLFIFALCISNLRPLVLLGFAHCVEILRPASRIHTKTPRNDVVATRFACWNMDRNTIKVRDVAERKEIKFL